MRGTTAVAAGTRVGFETRLVIVDGIDSNGMVSTHDQFGIQRQISRQYMTGSGALPQPGDQWIIDQSLGTWTFTSRVAAALPVVVDLPTLLAALASLGIIIDGTAQPTITVTTTP